MSKIPPPPPPKPDPATTLSPRFNGPWTAGAAGPPPWPAPATPLPAPGLASSTPPASPVAARTSPSGQPAKPRFGAVYHHNFAKLVACGATLADVLVYAFLCICRNAQTGRCDPKRRTIAKETGLNPTTVSEALTRLQRNGLVTRHERHAGSARNRYELAGFPPPTNRPK